MLLKKRLLNKIILGATLFLLGFSVLSMANTATIDEKIAKIQQATGAEKERLIKQLKEEISEQKYDSTEKNSSKENNTSVDLNTSIESNSSIDEKIKNRASKSIAPSKCNVGRCGMGKCGMGKCGMSQEEQAKMHSPSYE